VAPLRADQFTLMGFRGPGFGAHLRRMNILFITIVGISYAPALHDKEPG
jgi:hypothetical protein